LQKNENRNGKGRKSLQKWVDTSVAAVVEVLADLHQEGGDIAEALVGAEAQEGTVLAHAPVPGHPLAHQGTEAGQDTESIPDSQLCMIVVLPCFSLPCFSFI